MTTLKKNWKSGLLLGLVPALVIGSALFALNACGPGSAPDSATGPDSTYDPLFDEARPGISVRVRPNTVTLPGPANGDATVDVVARYNDPDGNPQAGLQMNFTVDPVNPNVTLNPSAAFTDTNGVASTQATIKETTPGGSLTFVAYTSPASSGPNARGQARVVVNQTGTSDAGTGTSEELAVNITTGSLPTGTIGLAYTWQLTFSSTGCTTGTFQWSAVGLPPGLTVSTDGTISGTPLGPVGTYPVSVQVFLNCSTGQVADTATFNLVII